MTQHFKINGKRGDVKHNVKILLEINPKLRDDLIRTVCSYWYHIDAIKNNLDLDELTTKQFFTSYCNGDFEHQASITRQWQKVQEEHPHLRGDQWKSRQKHTKTVKHDLGYGQK